LQNATDFIRLYQLGIIIQFSRVKESMLLPDGRAVSRAVTDCLVENRELLTEATNAPMDAIDHLLVESMDEALTGLLGKRAREAVFEHLERNCLLTREEIPNRLADFFALMDETFGKGSKTIAKVIAKRLYAKLGWEYVEIPSYEFEDYVRVARDRLDREKAAHSNHIFPE
jgi:hypothetical protein